MAQDPVTAECPRRPSTWRRSSWWGPRWSDGPSCGRCARSLQVRAPHPQGTAAPLPQPFPGHPAAPRARAHLPGWYPGDGLMVFQLEPGSQQPSQAPARAQHRCQAAGCPSNAKRQSRMDPWDMATSPASLCLLAAQLTVGTSSKLVAPPPPHSCHLLLTGDLVQVTLTGWGQREEDGGVELGCEHLRVHGLCCSAPARGLGLAGEQWWEDSGLGCLRAASRAAADARGRSERPQSAAASRIIGISLQEAQQILNVSNLNPEEIQKVEAPLELGRDGAGRTLPSPRLLYGVGVMTGPRRECGCCPGPT